ncbi:hypothetical protein [Aggregatilinea lenta]|uniref:hypothetical protein n=1 Tax=Aggregatilinea lenta TaxID=913108 RepID=UPI000E5AC5FB|nr:hypothetical protein [Aggregatilinea lenta]
MPDANGYLVPAERQILLRQHAPVLVLFPEDPAHAPYPDEGDAIYTVRSGYHPRAAELTLARARIRYRRRLLLRNPSLLFYPKSYQEEVQRARQSIQAEDLHVTMAEHRVDPRYAGLDETQVRPAMMARLAKQRLAQRVRGLDLPGFRGYNLKHWRLYFEYLESEAPQDRRSVIYGRLLQGLAPLDREELSPLTEVAQTSTYGPYDVRRSRVALQYWMHYYYDDWANRHEGDWESITLLLDLEPWAVEAGRVLSEQELLRSCAVRDVGYASHEDGYRRAWQDVQRTAAGRPIVYVARGSQASYFGWAPEGIPTSARVTIIEKLLAAIGSLAKGKRIFGRRWDAQFGARFTGRDPKNTDWVAADPEVEDRLSPLSADPVERLVPQSCRGVRREPDFGPDAGLDETTYHLETDDLFWLEMVQEFGMQWGEDYFMPGTKGPGGTSKKQRDHQRRAINSLARIELAIAQALTHLLRPDRAASGQTLSDLLAPLRPEALKAADCFPNSIQDYVYHMWSVMLRLYPNDAWEGGPGLLTRLKIGWSRGQGKLLDRDDPVFHLKALLAQVRRTRYEIQHEGSKWDNPFAWTRYVCRADTFFYGVSQGTEPPQLDLDRFDCSDRKMSAL